MVYRWVYYIMFMLAPAIHTPQLVNHAILPRATTPLLNDPFNLLTIAIASWMVQAAGLLRWADVLGGFRWEYFEKWTG